MRALVVSLALLPAVAAADQVVTRGGGTLDGEIVERGPDSIVVDIGGGTIGLPLSYVERIVPGRSPIAQYRERAARLGADDAAGWVALAHWARQHDLRSHATEAFQYVVSIDPDNAVAHQALGHVKVGGEWMTREEGYRARGLVSHEGRWITPDERDVAIAERQVAAAQARADAEQVAQMREIEARALEAEARARIVQAEARIAEEQADRIEALPLGLQWMPIGSPFGGAFWTPGLAPPIGAVVGPGLHGAVVRGCNLRARPPAARGVVNVPGRGGAFVVSNDLRPVVRR